MLTEEEKREMREMASSSALREEFCAMRRTSREIEKHLEIDQLVRWLTVMTRIGPAPAKTRQFARYANVKI
ncbi:MAG TPA: hypothetical protein VE131_06005 [Terriglobales bacterium]|nr:hypothetical protein [Terriglobales bacterium]